jgi:hypothetical protein
LNNYIQQHTCTREYIRRKRLQRIEQELDPTAFIYLRTSATFVNKGRNKLLITLYVRAAHIEKVRSQEFQGQHSLTLKVKELHCVDNLETRNTNQYSSAPLHIRNQLEHWSVPILL